MAEEIGVMIYELCIMHLLLAEEIGVKINALLLCIYSMLLSNILWMSVTVTIVESTFQFLFHLLFFRVEFFLFPVCWCVRFEIYIISLVRHLSVSLILRLIQIDSRGSSQYFWWYVFSSSDSKTFVSSFFVIVCYLHYHAIDWCVCAVDQNISTRCSIRDFIVKHEFQTEE